MVVGAAGREQPELVGDARRPPHGRRVERPVVDLEPAEPVADQLADAVGTRSGASRKWASTAMPPAAADRLDRLPRAQALARDVRRPPRADEPRERVLDASPRSPAAISARAIVGRPSASSSPGSSSATCVVDRQADLAQAATVRSNRPRRASRCARERRLERLVIGIHPEARGCAARPPTAGGRGSRWR